MPFDAIVVLGCRVGPRGELLSAARRRVERAAQAYRELGEPEVILSGGKRWHGRSEAESFAAELERLGVPRERMLCEERSLSTRENARESCHLASSRGFQRLGIVTCEWHLPRALAAFQRYGFRAEPIAARAPAHVVRARRLSERAQALWDRALIRLEKLGWLTLLVLLVLTACERGGAPGAQPAASSRALAAAPAGSERVRALLGAESGERFDALVAESLGSPLADVRAAAIRALARSTDEKVVERLLSGLADDSPRVLELAAFGLGRVGAPRANTVSRAVALRAASLLVREPAPKELDEMLAAMAGALGRLANDEAERTLRSWLALTNGTASASALALGELAARRGRLEDETYVALLDLAEREPPIDSALYAFGRVTLPAGALDERLRRVATRALAAGSTERVFALRALERLSALEPLEDAFEDPELFRELGAELARALARLGDGGKAALGRRIARAPSELSPLLESPELPAWLAVLDALPSAPPDARAALERLAQLPTPEPAWKARRAILLRCGAARALAGKAFDSAVLAACDPARGRIGQLAVLAVLERDRLVGARAARFRELVAAPDALVRQAAVRVLVTHAELQDTEELLARALADRAPGTVAAAAEVLAQKPERARAGRAVGATSPLVGALVDAYRAQSNGENPAVLGALIDAAAALQVLSLSAELERTCASSSAALRERAERALRSLGRLETNCRERATAGKPPEELTHLRTRPATLRFETELGELELMLDPRDAPLAVTRIVDLARAGFYDGVEIHRSVPGFVLQFGDRAGDGYGGAGRPPLRSELGPRAFQPGAVGLAESGLDTGSSQVFITLGRFPHLDGNSSYLGQAAAGWERLVIYDRILRARVVD